MNTPAHLLFGAAAFAHPDRKGTAAASFAGALTPDISLYLMVGVSIWVLNVPPVVVFREYYYSDAWQAVFAVDNSFVIWGLLLGVALWRKSQVLTAFSGSGLLHLAFDFPLHTHDARQHFWPISDWVFNSPFSYWDNRAHAGVIGSFELVLSLVFASLLWRRFRSWKVRGFTAALALMELSSSGFWRMIF